jgi:diguanylate cyclase (GGDEF)-like protein
VGRHGGEEFVVALRAHDLPRAATIAERIRIGIGVAFEGERNLPSVTVSIGVAAGHSAQMDSLLQDADCALYRAKNEGRNRVMLADGPLIYAAAA